MKGMMMCCMTGGNEMGWGWRMGMGVGRDLLGKRSGEWGQDDCCIDCMIGSCSLPFSSSSSTPSFCSSSSPSLPFEGGGGLAEVDWLFVHWCGLVGLELEASVLLYQSLPAIWIPSAAVAVSCGPLSADVVGVLYFHFPHLDSLYLSVLYFLSVVDSIAPSVRAACLVLLGILFNSRVKLWGFSVVGGEGKM